MLLHLRRFNGAINPNCIGSLWGGGIEGFLKGQVLLGYSL